MPYRGEGIVGRGGEVVAPGGGLENNNSPGMKDSLEVKRLGEIGVGRGLLDELKE